MYRVLDTPDKEAFWHNGEKFHPVATLVDEFDGRAQITIDDHCYVLLLRDWQNRLFYNPTPYWFREAVEVLQKLPLPTNG